MSVKLLTEPNHSTGIQQKIKLGRGNNSFDLSPEVLRAIRQLAEVSSFSMAQALSRGLGLYEISLFTHTDGIKSEPQASC